MKKRFSFLLATMVTAITLIAAVLPATVANAALVGPIDPRSVAPGSTALLSGFPAWYQDDNGVRIELFPANLIDNLIAPPTPGSAYEAKLGFNTAFYWNATDDGTVVFPNGGTFKVVFGLEAVASLGGAITVGDETVFSRILLQIKPGVPGDYIFQHPWGQDTVTVTAVDVANNRNVRFANDVGAVPRVFTAAITPPAARQTTFLKSLSAPPGKLGDGVTAGPVTGGKLRNNVIISGPAGTVTINNFIVAGRLFPNVLPVASFTTAPATGAAPLSVSFTDTSTGPPLSWSWNFGDASTTALSTLQNPTHVFTAPGTFTVTETVTNTVGIATITKPVIVTAPVPAIPVASFVMDQTTGSAPLVVNFTDTTSGAPTGWSWNFGDGTPVSTIQNPSHTFLTAGTFTITELANNALGAAASSKIITVTPPVPAIPVATFTMTPATGTPPLSVKFTDTTSGVPTSWSWSFGDGGTSTLQNPTHVYNAAGLFAVTETATNALGTSTVSQVVTVAAPPAAPTALTATVVSSTQVNLAWTDNSNNESLWMIQRATDTAFSLNLVEVHSPATNTVAPPAPVTFNDLTAAAATTYFYRIIAGGTVGNSTPSNVVTVTTPAAGAPPAAVPAAPTVLTATVVSATQVRLSWTDNAANETTFVVQRATDAAFTAGFLSRNAAANAVAAPSPMSFLDTAAAASTTYFYRVLAGNAGGNSAPSNAVTVTTPAAPAAPPPPVVAPPPPPPAAGAPPPPPAPAPSGGGVGSPVPAPATNSNVNLAGLISNSGLTADSDGKVQADSQVKTSNDDLVLNVPGGTLMKDKDGARIATIGASITAAPPAPPSGATILLDYNMGPDGAKFTPSIGIKMKFDPAKLPASFPKSALYIATWDGAKWNKMESSVDAAANVVSALTTHFSEFAVIADPAAVPPPATTAPAPTTSTPPKTTAAPPPAPIEPKPTAPQGLTASISKDNQVVLHWTHDAATNEVGFMIERAEDAAFIKNMEEFHAPDLSQTFVDVTVAAGKTYFYRVMAVHGLGESDPSAVVTVTTPAPAPAATSTPPAATSTPPAATSTPPATTTPAPVTPSGGSATVWIILGIAAVVVIALVILVMSRKKK